MNKRRSRTEWQALIDEQIASGLTQKAFCGQQGISLATFSYWRRKLQAESSSTATPTSPSIDTVSLADWIELPTQGSATDGGWQIELELGSGLCLRLRQG
ncbi:IS66 family insertion sequence element accessory protein TnpA [Thiolapillus sp.]|uniref:IS66 family insertion sequence element accessory protein TnpA n=1 Tax=Thiolapillus sp. TaxID=2017437 RepID=UPI003AF5DE38